MGTIFRFLGGLIVGALVGGGVGVLMAPQAGQETQDAIKQRVNLVVDEGRRAAAERRAELESQFAHAKSTSH